MMYRLLQRLNFWSMAIVAGFALPAFAHHPTKQEIDKAKKDGSYDRRLQATLETRPHRMDSSLLSQARFKLRYAAYKAQGLSNQEISNKLFGGPQMAFPFAANPELRANGTVKTLTVLVDFKDNRASVKLPGMTATTIAPNIYGQGTKVGSTFVPFESVNAYYTRASHGKVNVQGNVLGWYSFPKNRSEYESTGSDIEKNRAIFKMVTEALDSFASVHDFSQYDNDNDGDIDLVTILYAGDDTGWGSFWWAYRWEFFITEALNKKYNGKRLKQFVFQFVSRRGPTNDDFDPTTLMHEMGHAFGLADYYDYQAGVGPDGGIGGLDMMDANVGNHCAFSRWLLDWIQPEIVNAGPPATRHLIASGSSLIGPKAVAIFPSLASSSAPDQELFVIENRFRVGNDAKIPGEGLLVWHIDSRPNFANNDFLNDNSFTDRLLIRLVRADGPFHFQSGEFAGPKVYFRSPQEFTPTSTPPSRDYANQPTGISITQISAPGESVSASIGFTSIGPAPAPASEVAVGLDKVNRDIQMLLKRNSEPAIHYVNIEELENLRKDLQVATPEMMKTIWASAKLKAAQSQGQIASDTLALLILGQWAGRDGENAVNAVLELPKGELQNKAFKLVMEAWAHANAHAATEWYLDPIRDELRKSRKLVAGEGFARQAFRWLSLNDIDKSLSALKKIHHASEVWGAIHSLDEAHAIKGRSSKELNNKLNAVTQHQESIEALRQLQETLHHLDEHITDPMLKREILQLMKDRIQNR